ncbi:LacI family DNA-binding transcriptional regulator [Nakamurella lactea]|uniref:LacI family DNA-binding transcriptional regulator n=1 Tax=Nakamurella lactea TaxID=459515 RepID=UPI0003F77730|nr:LacI family DNA-binding transcriptional regulator [Nakamurella lactea]
MARNPTIADVAERAGVSKGAVSFAFNGRPGVASATKERILAAAAELGYAPSYSARSLSNRRADAIGLVLARPPELLRADPFFPPFIAGLESVLAPTGRSLVLRFVSAVDEMAAYTELSRSNRIDGAIVADLRVGDQRPALLAELRVPFVSLNRPDTAGLGPAVCLDDRPGVRDAVNRLIALGHTRIGHIAGPAEFLHANSRQAEWAGTLAAAGLPPGPLVETDFTAGSGAAATERLLALADRPTALLYANDLMAIAGMSVAQRKGLRVPEDLSVIGFDDTEISGYLHPALASVRTDAYGWGAAAGGRLTEHIDNQDATDLELPAAQFVPRGSIGRPGGS